MSAASNPLPPSTEPPAEAAQMTLFDHLSELRTRLWKATVAVLILGGLSLSWSREIFGLLMAPVLAALPEASRALVYTSGIEEMNVLLKVGLYAGLFLSAPVILFQIWGFIAPGLYVHERRMVLPFVGFGTVFFVGGALFCYLAVLPTMFQFLLREGDEAELHERIVEAEGLSADASRLLFAGQAESGVQLLERGTSLLTASGPGEVAPNGSGQLKAAEFAALELRLSAQLDRALMLLPDLGADGHAEYVKAVQSHRAAVDAQAKGKRAEAATELNAGATRLAGLLGRLHGEAATAGLGKVLQLDGLIAAARQREADLVWTRPMLTMREQLSLVLLMEVAFGVIFELPLILGLLAFLGLVDWRFLARYQRHAIVLCVVLAAVITPSGDAVNLALMAGPMVVCYELGIVAAWLVGKRKSAAVEGAPAA